MSRMGRFVIHRQDSEYPRQLLRLDRPPEALYCMGDPSLLVAGLAVIGSRRQTPYGRECTALLAGWAASRGVPIISGAAVGCDQSAHRAAIEAGGRTVAVLGCGADLDYPPSAKNLLATIRRDHLVVSELPWGAPPARWTFPARNRIIAGLAHAVLVVEASLPSGTFSTADHALQTGTEVFAVPGSILSPCSRGTNRLIRDGAGVVADVEDLATALTRCGLLDHDASSAGPELHNAPDSALAAALAAAPMTADALALALGRSVREVARELAMLEIDGVVRRTADGQYCYASRPCGG